MVHTKNEQIISWMMRAGVAALAWALTLSLGCEIRPKTPISPTAQWHEVTATANIPDIKPVSRAEDRAVKMAEEDARKKMIDYFDEVELPSGQTILEAMRQDPYLWSKIMGVLKTTSAHEQTKPDSGTVEVRLKFDMDFAQRVCLQGREAGPTGPREGAPVLPASKRSDLAGLPPMIAMIGDSLTQGVGASEGNDLPSLIARLIGRPVANFGKRGDTALGASGRIDHALGIQPETVIVFLGGNDFLRDLPIEATERGLVQIIKACHEQRARVLLVGFQVTPGDDYAQMFYRLAFEYGCALEADVLRGVMVNPELKTDVVHLNDQGYAIVAQRVASALRR